MEWDRRTASRLRVRKDFIKEVMSKLDPKGQNELAKGENKEAISRGQAWAKARRANGMWAP